MRPLLLRLDGFGSFREPTEIDFSDVEYFALVGPTGAGKSTIIDALCFALYGTVPRWGKENVIAHALAPSAASGKVGLIFESEGRRYAVVRALARDSKGTVRTKEARLDELDPREATFESVLKPVAEGDDVTAEVQRVTGLEYRFFTQCVVLPQGEFARFLHAAPRERQDLLIQLLEADVYDRIRQRAVREEETARQAAAFARDQLAQLAGATPQAEREAEERALALRALADGIGTDLELLRARNAEIQRTQEALRELTVRITGLRSLTMPPEVPTLAATAREAAEAVAALEAEAAALDADERAAERALAELGERGELMAALAALEAHERLSRSLERARETADEARRALPGLAEALRRAEQALAAAERERDRLRDAHAGAGLAARLAVGEPCPVCLRAVTELPHHGSLSDLGTAERAVMLARGEAEQARAAHGKADSSAAVLADQARRLEAELAALPRPSMDRASIQAGLEAVAKAEQLVSDARKAARACRTRLDQARARAQQAARQAEDAWRALEAARDRLLALGRHADVAPPPVDRADLHRAWQDLIEWRNQEGIATRAVADETEQALAGLKADRDAELARLSARLAEHGVTAPDQPDQPDQIAAAVAAAVTRAEGALERIREQRSRAARLEKEVAEKEEAAKVAHELELRLRANAFERWLCAEALATLVATASDTLRELSDGQYELALGDRSEIEVIDYAEAGMRRSARTLSGGETFQAALALALALSGTVARGLESIFLDEGFGTLDPATLDTVATTLERLAAGQERMVGVVTHVPALAERVPVRFAVSRDTKGSHVRRVGP
ncbi:AAA family ATPase [Thermoactinospora rubra]|uniref:AAA family ATPase n=1 Tax=Thermoactinospora rubra TaxID=1088767 RepID=UPI000A0F8678|nr:SMC family ATPase [Thermoactinospora rubra]